jgi:hypothetical protein
MSRRGPLPDPTSIRRNKPTVPTTNLPAGGRQDPPPSVPAGYEFSAAAAAWWEWAWSTPQAAAWDDGAIYVVARRAQLEGDLAALGSPVAETAATLADLLGVDADDSKGRIREVCDIFAGLKRAAGNEVSLMREMRELDGKLGLTPESLARLRWTIVSGDDEQAAAPPQMAKRGKSQTSRRGRLSVVK